MSHEEMCYNCRRVGDGASWSISLEGRGKLCPECEDDMERRKDLYKEERFRGNEKMKGNSIAEGCPDCGCPLDICCGERLREELKKAKKELFLGLRLFPQPFEENYLICRGRMLELEQKFEKRLGLENSRERVQGKVGK